MEKIKLEAIYNYYRNIMERLDHVEFTLTDIHLLNPNEIKDKIKDYWTEFFNVRDTDTFVLPDSLYVAQEIRTNFFNLKLENEKTEYLKYLQKEVTDLEIQVNSTIQYLKDKIAELQHPSKKHLDILIPVKPLFLLGFQENKITISEYLNERLEATEAQWKSLINILSEETEKEVSVNNIFKNVFNENNNNITGHLKLKWQGTPGEFGAIMNELIDKGYLPKIKDLKNTVRVLSNSFEVRNDQGEIVDQKYLYKCFGEKKKSYFSHEFKIAYSDNTNKGK